MTAQSETGVDLKCHIIPVKAGNLLVPEHLIAEIVTLDDSDNEGNIAWRNRIVPIIDNNDNSKVATRVVVIKSVMGYQRLPYIAIATDGIPYPIVVNPDLLSELELSAEDQVCDIAASYVRVGSLDCIVPDLPKVERQILKRSTLTSSAELV